MSEEKNDTLLTSLTRISSSEEVRQYERSLLSKYAKIMKNRQDFILKNQKNTTPSNPSFDELMFSFDEENFSNF
ncbi:MAG: hypothetical protein IJY92_03240 [Alphaproteobacteria bacterium]|nr:hypothetical protein [Alphaproteobacteria bacterium]